MALLRTTVRRLLLAVVVLSVAALAAGRRESALAQSPPQHPVASASSLDGDAARTRFVVQFDRAVPFRIFALADPYRVIVDLPQVAFQLPQGAGQSGEGLVTAYRYGLIAVGKSRIVLDTEKPVRIESAAMAPAEEGRPARLIIDLAATSRKAFLAEVQKRAAPPPAPPPLPPVRPDRKGDAKDVGALPAGRTGEYVIVIDAGHGGIDAGAIGAGGVEEKEIVLEFAQALKAELEKSGRYKVLMTRDSDIFLALRERVEFARSNNASLFVSIHADKFRGSSVRGATVYTLSEEASDAETAELAAKENKADLIAGLDLEAEPDEVTDILISLAQRETKNLSVRFAKRLVTDMRGAVRMNRNPHRFAGFRVLKAPDVPSVLIELGYVSNAADVREMMSTAWRKRAASAITSAVEGFHATQFAGATD